jgi:nucleoside-diphosphate kinase
VRQSTPIKLAKPSFCLIFLLVSARAGTLRASNLTTDKLFGLVGFFYGFHFARPAGLRLFFMAIERTFSIVKPDGVRKNLIGAVLQRFEQAGLQVIAARMVNLSQAQAEGFYGVHRERPFFKDLVKYMTSGPVVIQVLEGENAVARNRELMGATDPKKAAAGTIRADFASSIEENVVHGSDSAENAAIEIAFFFAGSDLCPRA